MKDFSNENSRPDHVICCNCGADILVDNDVCICPVCGKEGCLMDVEQEVDY